MIISSIDYVWEKLQQLDALLLAQVDPKHSPFEAALADLITAGGKRLRPRIALLSGFALGADPLPLLSLATSIEMLHTASLIHDDLVDGSLLRRGMETLNARWSSAVSVLIGDLAFTRASRLINNTRSFPAIEMFTLTMQRMVDGEVTHLARPHRISSRDEYFRWIDAKTAALFEFAMGAPALLSPAGRDVHLAACRFGRGIGVAFQIVDDVLDFIGETAQLGKPVGNDLRHGVVTLPALIYFENHPPKDDVDVMLADERLDGTTLMELIERIQSSEAIDQSLEIAREFIRKALEDLEYFHNGPERFALDEIAWDIVERIL